MSENAISEECIKLFVTFKQNFFSPFFFLPLPPSIRYRLTLEIYDLENFKVGTNNFKKFSPETLS